MLREASEEIVAEEEAEVTLSESSSHAEGPRSCPRMPEMSEDTSRKENNCVRDLGSQPPSGTPTLVNISNYAPKAELS